jgi:hypothetical protein
MFTMKTTVTFSEFHDSFKRMDRDGQFSYEGFRVLFEYFEQYEEETGEDIELDVIAVCCDFEEQDAQGIIEAYSLDCDEGLEQDELDDIARNYLIDEGVFVGECKRNQSFVYRQH